ncbi:MAG: outer membrane protein assembly factor BamA [Pseudomonadota bacterium]
MTGRFTVFAVMLLTVCGVFLADAQICLGAPVVTDIRIIGTQRVEDSGILKAMALGVGDPYAEDLVTLSIRNLYRLGVFSRVSVDEEPSANGVALIVRVTEFPMIRRIEFKGRKSVDEAELRKALKLKTYSFADPGAMPEEVRALEDVYNAAGYHGTKVSAKINKADNGVVIVYNIEEAEKSLIHEIDIIGNRNVEDREIRKIMLTKEIGPLSFISDSGGYDAAAAADDLQRIQYLYMEKGFLDIKVGDPVIKMHPAGKGLYLSITVDEGPKYTLAGVRYSGDWQELPDHVRREPDVKVGDVFVRSKILSDLKMYENSYRDVGYAWCRIEPLFEKDPDKAEVVLNLVLKKGPLVHVRWIQVSGNAKTRDYVIRREMRIAEGDLYNQKEIDDSALFIRRVGFFSAVDIRPVNVGDDLADIHVKVEEGPAGTFTAGASYSNVSGLVGTLRLSLGNFSGRGQKLNLSLEAGGDLTTYSISFTEPRLFSGGLSFGLDLFNKTNEYTTYSQDSRGGSIRLGYRLGDSASLNARYRYAAYNIYDVDLDASNIIIDSEGRSSTSSVRLGYSYDTRDFPLDPQNGLYLRFSTELAGGALGGTNDFVRYQAEGSFFKPLAGDLIGLAHIDLGLITPYDGDEIPLTERYFMGGLYTLRGFDHRMVGPLEDGDPVGGTRSFLVNLEATYPLIKDAKIKGVLFLDSGNVWAEDEKVQLGDLRYGAGFGFRWSAPIGLLRLEWGFNLDPRPDEEQPGWEFSIGTLF